MLHVGEHPGHTGGNSPYVDYRVTQVLNTLSDSGQVSGTYFAYGSTMPYNLRTDVFEYDYGSGGVGNFLRRTHTDYQTNASYTSDAVHLLNLAYATWVSSDYNGTNFVSYSIRVRQLYKHYQPPLVDRTSITGHNTSFNANYTTRGNVTKVTRYSSIPISTVSSYLQFDIAGNVLKMIDPNLNANTLEYFDRFGSPDDEAQSNSPPPR